MTAPEEQELLHDLVTLGVAFDGLRQAVRVDMGRRNGRDGLPDLELAVVLQLSEHPGQTAAALARALERPLQQVNRALGQLAALDLVTSEASPASWSTTEAGEAVRHDGRTRAVHHLRYTLAALSASDVQLLLQARPALQHLARALSR